MLPSNAKTLARSGFILSLGVSLSACLELTPSPTPTLTPSPVIETITPPSPEPSPTGSAPPAPTATALERPPPDVENLLSNVWFEDPANPTVPSLHGWVNNEGLFGCSRKVSPGSPNNTAAAWGKGPVQGGCEGGYSGPDQEGWLYQTVETNPDHQVLYFAVWSIRKSVHVAEVLVLCGDSPSGPFEQVWTPIPSPPGAKKEWTHTGWLRHTLPEGFPYCRIAFHGISGPFDASSWKFVEPFFSTAQE